MQSRILSVLFRRNADDVVCFRKKGAILRYFRHEGMCGLLSIAICISVAYADNVSAGELKVNAADVALRVDPDENSQVITRVSKDDILVSDKNVAGPWIQVIPPDRLNFWIHGEFVKDGLVTAPRVPVRIGPGTSHRSVGELKKDDKISVRGEYREWIKIAPPQTSKLWVSRKFVDPVDEPASPEENGRTVIKEKPVVSGEKQSIPSTPAIHSKPAVRQPATRVSDGNTKSARSNPGSPVAPAVISGRLVDPPPEAAVTNRLVSSKDQGRVVEYEGILRHSAVAVWRQPGKYRLVPAGDHASPSTICYVVKDEKQLAVMKDKTVTVSGREYWLQGFYWPVVIPDKILVRE